MDRTLLNVKNLKSSFPLLSGTVVHPVDDVSLMVEKGDIVGIVGESGCGKSMTALSIIGLVPPPGKITQGEVLFEGSDLLKLPIKELWKVRGSQIATIFQDPMTYLNPVQTIGAQIEEAIRLHTTLTKAQARELVVQTLKEVGIPAPERVAKSYPFELSGGMRQRVLIAIAICCRPKLLIADEPTTALDVTVQAQILSLLKRLVQDNGISLMLITHDMGIVADVCNKIYVMYAGQVVESGTSENIYYSPKHPYTQALLESVLTVVERKDQINTIPGFVPSLSDLPEGCRFSTRCQYACQKCQAQQDLRLVKDTHYARCWRCDSSGEEQ